ncbi:hypothetical protein GF325_19220 [Candidatus Bathyarchaeota archaeon]|nr:hypothetical protein [Candidatus Bathyarchaeota archaeon]
MPSEVYIKVSGTILDDGKYLIKTCTGLVNLAHENLDTQFHVIMGGGARVDALRKSFRENRMSLVKTWRDLTGETLEPRYAAHWLAIQEMEKNGKVVQELFEPVGNLNMETGIKYQLQQADTVPESWDVTSDSIIYWLAVHESKSNERDPIIILLKPVDGVLCPHDRKSWKERRDEKITGSLCPVVHIKKDGTIHPRLHAYPFDRHISHLVLEYGIPFYIVNVRLPWRINGILKEPDEPQTPCTKVSRLPNEFAHVKKTT